MMMPIQSEIMLILQQLQMMIPAIDATADAMKDHDKQWAEQVGGHQATANYYYGYRCGIGGRWGNAKCGKLQHSLTWGSTCAKKIVFRNERAHAALSKAS